MTDQGKVSQYSNDITHENLDGKERVTVKVSGDTRFHEEIYSFLERKLDSVKDQVELKMQKEK